MRGWRPFGWDWNELGKHNPLGAILTTRDGQRGDWDLGDFLATGRVDLERFLSDLEGVSPQTAHGRVLDFGCGVGRVTRGLADHFQSVVGADIAPSMLTMATTLHADCDRITWLHNRQPHLRRFANDVFDVIYCRLVLQHIRPPIVRGYLAEFIRVLKPGGVLMFQLPEAIWIAARRAFLEAPVVGSFKQKLPRPIVRAWRLVKYRALTRPTGAVIEMFGIDRSEVEAVITRSGGRPLWVKPDDAHGPDGRGFEYWVTK